MLRAEDEFEKKRCELITKTAGFRLIINRIITKHGTKNLKGRDLDLKFFDPRLEKDLDIVSAELRLPKIFLINAIAGTLSGEVPIDLVLPIHFASDLAPLPTGFYIKVSAHTRKDTVIKSYEEIKQMLIRLRDSQTKEDGPKLKVSVRNTPKRDDVNKLNLFNKTEEIILVSVNKDGSKKKDIVAGKPLTAVITEALNYASEEVWGQSDLGKAKAIYRSILDDYQIPSYLQLKKLLLKIL